MRLLKDKVFIRITKESRDGVFSKEITRHDGTKVKLYTNVEAGEVDDRRATLFTHTGIVEAVSDNVKGVKVGDTAILDYKVCNLDDRIVSKNKNGTVYWLEAKTTYHDEDLIAYANRRSPRDQMAYAKGDYDNISMLLGVFRDDKILAREPYVFLDHESNTIAKVSAAGIIYSETQSHYQRTVLASSPESQKYYGLHPGDTILVHDYDVFLVKIGGMSFDVVCDADALCSVNSTLKVAK